MLNLWAKRNAMRVRGERTPPVDEPTDPLPR